MKKIFLILAVGVAATLSSCIKDAEVTAYVTPDSKDAIAAEDPGKIFDAAVVGIYTDIQSYVYANQQHNNFGQKSFDYLSSLLGNDLIMTGRFGMSFYHYQLSSWSDYSYWFVENRWREYYNHIANANSILSSISADETNPEVLKYKAYAQTARGYAYLHLSYLFSLPYYMGAEGTAWGMNTKYSGSNADAPCVPIIKEDTQGDQPRATVGEVYELILSDLTAAYDFFAANGMLKTATPTDFDGLVAANYLMRAHMIMHNWTEAEKYAKVIIDNSQLATAAQLMQGFSDINLPNIIFGADITVDNSTIYMSYFSQMDMFGDGYGGIGVWRAADASLMSHIPSTDIRRDWFVCPDNYAKLAAELGLYPEVYYQVGPDGGGLPWYQACKFVGAGRANVVDGYGEGWELGDYIYLRSEEAHFCLAEIYAHQNKLDDAIKVLSDLIVVRDAAYAYDGAKTKADVITEINIQKRIEFWGEGLEFIDNRRLNIPLTRNYEGSNHLAACAYNVGQEDNRFVYMIPVAEIEANSMIDDEDQNVH